MKQKLYLALTFCFCFTIAKAQKAKWDSTYRPGLYEFKVQLYKSYPHTKKDIVLLGNSITDRADWNEILGIPHIHNRGISGDITSGVLQRLDEVIDGQPAKVFILIGINDISRNIPDSVILINDKKIVDRIKAGSPRTKIYFETLMPTNNTFTQFKHHYNKDEHIKAVNDGLKKLAKEEHITLIDIHPYFLDEEGKLDKRYTLDGLHPNAEGYKVYKKLLMPYLK